MDSSRFVESLRAGGALSELPGTPTRWHLGEDARRVRVHVVRRDHGLLAEHLRSAVEREAERGGARWKAWEVGSERGRGRIAFVTARPTTSKRGRRSSRVRRAQETRCVPRETTRRRTRRLRTARRAPPPEWLPWPTVARTALSLARATRALATRAVLWVRSRARSLARTAPPPLETRDDPSAHVRTRSACALVSRVTSARWS